MDSSVAPPLAMPYVNSDVRLVLVARKDLRNQKGEKIHTGKLISQAGHAVESFALRKWLAGEEPTEEERTYATSGTAKITLKAETEEQLLDVYERARQAGLTVHLVVDAGLTEFGKPTRTCLAIGPHAQSRFEGISDHLSLF
jgi:PTH2 family peptidyl-tRNA hydrolase